MLRVFGAGHVAQALGGNRADGCERILDAVVKFFEDQLLKLVGRLAFPRVNTSLSEQLPRIDFGLREQQSKTDVLRLQKLRWMRRVLQMKLIWLVFNLRQRSQYHYGSGAGHNDCDTAGSTTGRISTYSARKR